MNNLQGQAEERALSFLKFSHECDIPALYCIRRGDSETVSSVSANVDDFQRMICHLAIKYAEQFGAEAGLKYIQILGATLMSIDKDEFAKHCEAHT